MRYDGVVLRFVIIASLFVLLPAVLSFYASGQVEDEGLSVSLDTSNVEIVLGHQSDHVLTVENKGDIILNVTIKFEGDYRGRAWVERYNVPVSPGKSREINMIIYAPIGEVEKGNHTLVITATALETGDTDSYTVWVQVKEEEEEADLTWLFILIPVILVPLLVGFITYRVIVNMQKTFKVFEIFIVYNDGRLMRHFPENEENEEDISISAMFTAIQEFMNDSFEYGPEEEQGYLSEVVFGNIKVYIEKGVQFYIALVTKGEPPRDLRKRMKDIRQGMEDRFEEQLEEWDGNLESFEEIVDISLDQELEISYRSK